MAFSTATIARGAQQDPANFGKPPVYRISLSNNGKISGNQHGDGSSRVVGSVANGNHKLTTFAQVKAGKEPLVTMSTFSGKGRHGTNMLEQKSASTTSLLGSGACFGGSSLRAASNYVIKIPVNSGNEADDGAAMLLSANCRSNNNNNNRSTPALDRIDLAAANEQGRSRTVSVTPGGKTVVTPEDPGRLRVYVPAPDKPIVSAKYGHRADRSVSSHRDENNLCKEGVTVYEACRMSPLESRYSLTLSSGQLSPAEDGLDSGLSSNGTTPPPQTRRLVTATASSSSTGEVESDGDSDSTSSCHDSLGNSATTATKINNNNNNNQHQQHLVRLPSSGGGGGGGNNRRRQMSDGTEEDDDDDGGGGEGDSQQGTPILRRPGGGGEKTAAGTAMTSLANSPPATPLMLTASAAALPPPEDFRDREVVSSKPNVGDSVRSQLLREVKELSKRLKPVAEAQMQRERHQQQELSGKNSGSNNSSSNDNASCAAASAAAAVAPLFTERSFDERFAAFEAKAVSRLAASPEEATFFDFHLKETSSPSPTAPPAVANNTVGERKCDTSSSAPGGGGGGGKSHKTGAAAAMPSLPSSSSAARRKIDAMLVVDDRESFAGVKNLGTGERVKEVPITSVRGTVRGVKNRVRAGIATFQQQGPKVLSYKEKEAGKLVVYTTNLGVIRDTYHKCQKVKTILRTLLVKFEERDVYLNRDIQSEFRERAQTSVINVPQVYMDGMWLADAELLEKLNETGELRRLLQPFKRSEPEMECRKCGGYRMLPCGVCNGSKKSVHRNNFTLDFIALKCMNCDESGLEKCDACSGC